MNKPIDNFIYDFDGTLSNSYPVFLKIVLEIAEEQGAYVPCAEQELHRLLKNRNVLAYRVIEWKNDFSYADFHKAFEEKQIKYAKEFELYPHAKEILEAVQKSGKRNFLYTHSGKPVYPIIAHMGIEQYFTSVLDASQGFPSKPAPDALNYLSKEFSLDPARSVMIGDRPLDVEAGANAGMQSCFWDVDGYFPNTPATYHIQALKDILKLIDQ